MSDTNHYSEALDNIAGAEEVTGHEPEDRAIFALTAQAHATLALAYEQHTANLIALYSMDESARQGMVDGADMHSGNWVDVTVQIKERLGL